MANNDMDVNSDSLKKWTALCRAVVRQQPKRIENLLKLDIDFRRTDRNGNTLMHMVFKKYASHHVQFLIIKILNIFLNYGIDPNVMNNKGKTVLHLAIKFRMCDVIEFLITRGANLNMRDSDGDSMAHYVIDNEFDQYCEVCCSQRYTYDNEIFAQNESKNFFRWLLSKGLDVNLRNNDGLSPLYFAAQLNLQHIMFEILEYNDDSNINCVNKNNQNMLHNLLKFALTAQLGLKNKKKTRRLFYGHSMSILFKNIKSLLEKGISVDAVDINGETPVHMMLRRPDFHLSDLLMEKFSNVNACDSDGNTVLHVILLYFSDYHPRVSGNYVKMLLSRGANIHIRNNDGLVPLQIAALKQRINVIPIFQEYNADFNVLHSNGNLLHLFVTNKVKKTQLMDSLSIIDLLVCQGCDVNSRNEFGMTPLHLALRSCNEEIVDRLIEHGADLTAQELGKNKYTTLHLAVIFGYEEHLEMFIRAGVDIHSQDANGQTPLHLATKNIKILKKLLYFGAEVDLYDYEGYSPLDMALRTENDQSVKTLLRYGADFNNVNTMREIESLIRKTVIGPIIISHSMKLKYACLPVNESLGKWIDEYCEINDYLSLSEMKHLRIFCQIEIESMKKRKITGNESWYDFLHMNPNRQCAFLITNNITEKMFRHIFPTYKAVITAACHRARARLPLLSIALDAWDKLVNYCLPHLCVEHICSYLTNANLRDVIKSVQG